LKHGFKRCILGANQAVLDYTGLTIEDVATSDFRARIFHPEDIERLREERQAAPSAASALNSDRRGSGRQAFNLRLR
jgi:PAS domain-containing protein